MFSFLRSTQPPRTTTAHLDHIIYENGNSSQTFHPPTSEYFVTHVLPASSNRTFFAPPLHYHMNQTEYFRIKSGSGRWYLADDSRVYHTGEIVTIPIGVYHRFENASATEPLVVDIKLDPNKWEMEVRFFRNFFGYLEDCRGANTEPSLFQLLRFLYAVDGPLAVCPGWMGPRWVRNWMDWWVMVVLGVVVGEWCLGFRGSYSEYYKERAE